MSTSPNYARNLRKVYVFDGRENPIGSYDTVTACADALNVKRQAVTMAVSRASILDKKYYVSYKENFTRKPKQKEFNPLRPPVRAAVAVEPKPVAKAPKKVALKKPASPSPAKVKAASKRAASMALRSRSILFSLEEGLFGPFNAFH